MQCQHRTVSMKGARRSAVRIVSGEVVLSPDFCRLQSHAYKHIPESTMILATAQLRLKPGDVNSNVQQHLRVIQQAAEHKVDLLLFSELSLSGYEPALAAELDLEDIESKLFDKHCRTLQTAADKYQMTLCVGLPKSEGKRRISMRILRPHATSLFYAKQHLHSDEAPFFLPGNQDLVFNLNETKFAPAICYEALLPQFVRNCKNLGVQVFLASVAKHADGVREACSKFEQFARQHEMTILMSNCVGPCDNFISAGGSAIWNTQGKLLGQMDSVSEGMLLTDDQTGVTETVLLAT